MRIANSPWLRSAAVGALVGSCALLVAPAAVAAPGSVTICAKAPGESAPVSVEVGFQLEDKIEKQTYTLANNGCTTVPEAPAPSGVWADASRQAKRIVVATPAGTSTLRKTDRADFSLGSGEAVTVTFYFKPRP